MRYQAAPAGVPLVGRTVQTTGSNGVELHIQHPDGGGRALVCGARHVRGRVARIVADSVEYATITAWEADAQAPWACRGPRSGIVTARSGGTLSLGTSQFSTARTLTLGYIAGGIAAILVGLSEVPVVTF